MLQTCRFALYIFFGLQAFAVHADTATLSTFNQKWAYLLSEGQKVSPACSSFRELAKQKNVFLEQAPAAQGSNPAQSSPTAKIDAVKMPAAEIKAAMPAANGTPPVAAPSASPTSTSPASSSSASTSSASIPSAPTSPTANSSTTAAESSAGHLPPTVTAAHAAEAKPAQTQEEPKTPVPAFTKQQLLDTAEVLKKWPGFPPAQVQAYQLILHEKNPPVDLDQKNFVDGFSAFESCDFNKTLNLALRLKDNLNHPDLTPAERQQLVAALKSFLLNISDKPGHMFKTAVSISLARYLSENRLDEKLARKDRQIRALQQHTKFQIRDLSQLRSESNTSAQAIWNEMQESEKLRMELAKILFFP